jgi:hypothetical protein
VHEADEYNPFDDSAGDRRFEARLAALAEYSELRRRVRQHAAEPGDRARLAELERLLNGLGGLPDALHGPPRGW